MSSSRCSAPCSCRCYWHHFWYSIMAALPAFLHPGTKNSGSRIWTWCASRIYASKSSFVDMGASARVSPACLTTRACPTWPWISIPPACGKPRLPASRFFMATLAAAIYWRRPGLPMPAPLSSPTAIPSSRFACWQRPRSCDRKSRPSYAPTTTAKWKHWRRRAQTRSSPKSPKAP